MPFIVATYVYASSQGQRTHSARTNGISILSSLEQYQFYSNSNWPFQLCFSCYQSRYRKLTQYDGFPFRLLALSAGGKINIAYS
jgi:hypothetical protein